VDVDVCSHFALAHLRFVPIIPAAAFSLYLLRSFILRLISSFCCWALLYSIVAEDSVFLWKVLVDGRVSIEGPAGIVVVSTGLGLGRVVVVVVIVIVGLGVGFVGLGLGGEDFFNIGLPLPLAAEGILAFLAGGDFLGVNLEVEEEVEAALALAAEAFSIARPRSAKVALVLVAVVDFLEVGKDASFFFCPALAAKA